MLPALSAPDKRRLSAAGAGHEPGAGERPCFAARGREPLPLKRSWGCSIFERVALELPRCKALAVKVISARRSGLPGKLDFKSDFVVGDG